MEMTERVSYFKALLFIAAADTEISQSEFTRFEDLGNALELSQEALDVAMKTVLDDEEPLELILAGITEEATKEQLVRDLISLCYTDGDYSYLEQCGLLDICVLLHFDSKKLAKIEAEEEKKFKRYENAQKWHEQADNFAAGFGKFWNASKEGTVALGKSIASGSAAIAHSVTSGLGSVSSKIVLTFESAKKAKEENKQLREQLKKDTLTEAVKQKVIVQLHSKISNLMQQLKIERERNQRNEEMIRLLQAQIDDLMLTMEVAENSKTA